MAVGVDISASIGDGADQILNIPREYPAQGAVDTAPQEVFRLLRFERPDRTMDVCLAKSDFLRLGALEAFACG